MQISATKTKLFSTQSINTVYVHKKNREISNKKKTHLHSRTHIVPIVSFVIFYTLTLCIHLRYRSEFFEFFGYEKNKKKFCCVKKWVTTVYYSIYTIFLITSPFLHAYATIFQKKNSQIESKNLKKERIFHTIYSELPEFGIFKTQPMFHLFISTCSTLSSLRWH